MRGRVLPGGADWQLVRPDGVAELEALYVLETDDGARIHVHNRGIRFGPVDVMQTARAAAKSWTRLILFPCRSGLRSAAGNYDWLNRGIFVCTGARYPNEIVLRMYRLT